MMEGQGSVNPGVQTLPRFPRNGKTDAPVFQALEKQRAAVARGAVN
jgi:hypothetical protein